MGSEGVVGLKLFSNDAPDLLFREISIEITLQPKKSPDKKARNSQVKSGDSSNELTNAETGSTEDNCPRVSNREIV